MCDQERKRIRTLLHQNDPKKRRCVEEGASKELQHACKLAELQEEKMTKDGCVSNTLEQYSDNQQRLQEAVTNVAREAVEKVQSTRGSIKTGTASSEDIRTLSVNLKKYMTMQRKAVGACALLNQAIKKEHDYLFSAINRLYGKTWKEALSLSTCGCAKTLIDNPFAQK